MRCPNCLYNNHEQAEVCENCGESLLGEDRLFKTCPHCGYINDNGPDYCDACDEPLKQTGRRKLIKKKVPKKSRGRKRVYRDSSEGGFPWLFLIILIFIALILLGLFPQMGALAPVEWEEPATAIFLQGTSDHGIAENSDLSAFGALAMDPVGIIQMAAYVDGALVDAQAYSGATHTHYQPALRALPAGRHEVFIRASNAEGQTSVSQIITIEVDGSGGGALSVGPHLDLPAAPLDVRANLIDEGRRISVSWDPTDAPISSVRVYIRPPKSAGLVHLADLAGETTQYDFIPDQSGQWETYVAFVSDIGLEGELGFADQLVGELALDVLAEDNQPLPAPSHVQLATTPAQCQGVAAQLGPVRDGLHATCMGQLGNIDMASFLTWRWPLNWQTGRLLSDIDLNGFEVKLVVRDQNGQVLGEWIRAIPFSEARGTLRSMPDLDCGLQGSWYIRALGEGVVYAERPSYRAPAQQPRGIDRRPRLPGPSALRDALMGGTD